MLQVFVVATAVTQKRALHVVRSRVLDQGQLVVEHLAAVVAFERVHSVLVRHRLARRQMFAQRRLVAEEAAALVAHVPIRVHARRPLGAERPTRRAFLRASRSHRSDEIAGFLLGA